jgi:hypothetical protein
MIRSSNIYTSNDFARIDGCRAKAQLIAKFSAAGKYFAVAA